MLKFSQDKECVDLQWQHLYRIIKKRAQQDGQDIIIGQQQDVLLYLDIPGQTFLQAVECTLATFMNVSASPKEAATNQHSIHTPNMKTTNTPKMTKELEHRIGEARKDFALKRNWSPGFNSAKTALNYLKEL